LHGRRLLAGCAVAEAQAGRLVLVDLDETELGASARCKGVASSSLDAHCGFIWTGAGGNGIHEKLGWVGVSGSLLGFDLRLEYDTAQQRPLPQIALVQISELHNDTVDAAVPLLSLVSRHPKFTLYRRPALRRRGRLPDRGPCRAATTCAPRSGPLRPPLRTGWSPRLICSWRCITPQPARLYSGGGMNRHTSRRPPTRAAEAAS
jgi:hypothetical protein